MIGLRANALRGALRLMALAGTVLSRTGVALLPPLQLIELNRLRFAQSPHAYQAVAHKGLFSREQQLRDRYMEEGGTVLVLGSGTGREAIALAKQGFHVTGVDHAVPMIRLAQEAARQAGVSCDFMYQEVTRLDLPADAFDYVVCFAYLYSVIPTRRLRVALLKQIRRCLRPRGRCLLNFFVCRPSVRQRRVHFMQQAIAWVTWGNREVELGDRLARLEFFHDFADASEVMEEFSQAGMAVEACHVDELVGYAVLVRQDPSTGVSRKQTSMAGRA